MLTVTTSNNRKKLNGKSIMRSKLIESGLELPRQVIFKNWEPGGEYTVPLVLKNIQLETQKIHFQYNERIDFETADGQHTKVPILAVLPHATLELPDQLKFGLCAIQESITVDFQMSNTGDVPASFSWEVPPGYDILPRAGCLSAEETCKLTATFSPLQARVYNSSAVCTFTDAMERSDAEELRTDVCVSPVLVKLEGIGKNVHLFVEPSLMSDKSCAADGVHMVIASERKEKFESFSLDFGSVAVGCFFVKFVKVSNTSKVACHFSVQPYIPSCKWSIFSCDEEEKGLQPHSSTDLKITYAPKALNRHGDARYFIIKARGGFGCTKFKCIGQSEGPNVVVMNNDSLVDFGSVRCGLDSHRVLHFSNQSDIPATFQIQASPTNVFSCSLLQGEINPRSSQAVPVKFTPQTHIPYCRAVYVIVQHQEPLLVCFIGNGFSELQTPVNLDPGIIARYLLHAQSGISLLPPPKVEELMDGGQLKVDTERGVLSVYSDVSVSCFLPQPKKFSSCSSSNFSRYFACQNEISMVRHVTSDVGTLKFEYCSPSLSSEGKTVTLTNHTQGEVCCNWTTYLESFVVMPTQRNIMPKKSASFTLYFKPDRANEFYSSELECFIHYKELNDYRHVHRLATCPPWCVTVTLLGHTFTNGFNFISSKQVCDTTRLLFPWTTLGQPVFQTVRLTNCSKSSTSYDVSQDKNGIFTAKPAHGLIRNQYQLVVQQMLSPKTSLQRCALEYQLRSPATSYIKVRELYFRPTCVGSTSQHLFNVRNTTQFPIRFEWRIPGHHHRVVEVDPREGVIAPNEIQIQKWYFSPVQVKHYNVKVFLLSSFTHGTDEWTKCKAPLGLCGMGETGLLQCSPSSIDCGSMVVGSCAMHHFMLTNTGPCDLTYKLCLRERRHSSAPKKTLELTPSSGVVRTRSSQPLRVKVKPRESGERQFTIKYCLTSIKHDLTEDGCLLYDLAELKFLAAFPSLVVTDVMGGGHLSRHSKTSLWEMFSIKEINSSLHDDPSDLELRYTITTRHSLRHKMPVVTNTIVDCYFGAAPVYSESAVLSLKLKNDGPVPTTWAFQMPMDVWLEPESWADNEELNEVEEHESFILTNKLFAISPAKGCLQPGDRVAVTFTYKYSDIGVHKLPVLLKINMGREILLLWYGTTIERGKPFLYMNPKDRYLDPACIGSHRHFTQVVPLYNGGDTEARYEVGVEALQSLTNVSYHVPLIECLQPYGTIGPGQRLLLEFLFSPIEVMKYAIDVPIFLSTGETITISLVGGGVTAGTTEVPRSDALCKHIPTSDSILDLKQMASLSESSLPFKTIPQFAIIQRMVFVNNTSTHTLSYFWEAESHMLNEVITVDPVKDFVQPGKSAACKVVFFAQHPPANYTFDLICNVNDESELEAYEEAQSEWHKKEEEKRHLMVIEHKPHSSSHVKKKVSNSEEHQINGKENASNAVNITEMTYKEWQNVDLSKRSTRRPSDFTKPVNNEMPVRPKPLLLYLSVKAKVLSIPDYVKLHGNLEDFYIDYSLLAPKESTVQAIQQDELHCLTFVLNQVLREMLNDDNFQESLNQIKDEPMMYFNQFSSKSKAVQSSASKTQGTEVAADKLIPTRHESSHDESSAKHQSPGQFQTFEGDDGTHGRKSRKGLICLMEMQSVTEAVMEETLRNILAEIDSSELTINMVIFNS